MALPQPHEKVAKHSIFVFHCTLVTYFCLSLIQSAFLIIFANNHVYQTAEAQKGKIQTAVLV